ncbi:succinate dehydrogenase, hydrophobic membrane anchor protein [Candidatus Deianiraea vastatrix]|uniref:Succinate dehydrogenase hydrophobic membrane anchor protein n=1 Tax=Candidatus Deianiraea vastatrix TaxID=2163644 RepID=A0A5B8XF12_9RICK|nr:Putative succinate dehydrogenase hydrophobic membrane anchor protein [Candidatus Deianiraea vastatrix]
MSYLSHWINQRISGLFLLISSIACIFYILKFDLNSAIKSAIFSTFFLIFVNSGIFHGFIGITTIANDYIRSKKILILLISIICIVAITSSLLFTISWIKYFTLNFINEKI